EDETAMQRAQMAIPTSWHYPARFLPSCTSNLDKIITIPSAITTTIEDAAAPFALVSILLV
ncbi:hypothetical protein COCVIDRAFT_84226, partial [Bipolaris victoriae FI3]